MLLTYGMTGLITERDFPEAEAAFPGIERFYAALKRKPATFLDLVRLYFERGGAARRPACDAEANRGGSGTGGTLG